MHVAEYMDEAENEFIKVEIEGQNIGQKCKGCDAVFAVDATAYLQTYWNTPVPGKMVREPEFWCSECVKIVTLRDLIEFYGQHHENIGIVVFE